VRRLALLLVLFVPLAVNAQDDKPLPTPGTKGPVNGPLGFVQKLDGLTSTGGGLSQEDAEKKALDLARELKAANESGIASLTTAEQLLVIDKYLQGLDAQDPIGTAAHAFTIENLSNGSLARVIRSADKPNAPDWIQPLAQMAKTEAGVRGLDVQAIENQPLGEPRPTLTPHPFPNGSGRKDAPFQGANESDLEILARIVKGEVPANAPREGHVAVAAVVLNRVKAGRFGSTIAAVAHAPYQFSCYNSDQRDRLYWGTIPQYAWDAAKAALGGENPVPGCTHYFNPYLVHPSWANTMRLYRRIGTSPSTTHDFYQP
jgi:spore germination cell wall hydrolase CwlJ-like protein